MKNKMLGFITMTLGTIVTAAGVYFFKFPNNFSTGGVSGLVILMTKAFPDFSASQLSFIMNFALLIVGLIFLGKGFGAKTAYCSMLLSASLAVFEKLIPMSGPLTNQPLLELVFAVLIPSVGSALLFHNNASTGGMETVAMIFRKYTPLNIGTALLVSDALIAFGTLFVFGFETGLFSILGLLSKSLVVDWVTDSLTRVKNCILIVDKTLCDEVCDVITKVLHRGATVIDAKGYYTDDDKNAVISVIGKNQLAFLREQVKTIDPHAFLIVTNTSETYGRGFSTF